MNESKSPLPDGIPEWMLEMKDAEQAGLVERNRKALEWFVRFAQMDLDALERGDRAKLVIEADTYLSPRVDLESALGANFAVGYFRELKWVTNLKPPSSPKYWKNLKELQAALLSEVIWLSLPRGPDRKDNPPAVDLPVIEPKTGMRRMPVKMFVNLAWGKYYDFAFIPAPPSQKEYVRIKLYQTLQGLPTSTIQKCPGCEKIFLNFKLRRKKTYCSPKCMWRIIARGKREKQKEEEQKKEKEKPNAYMRKRRLKKIADARGVPIEKVRIQTRKVKDEGKKRPA